ncbi:hypothetical protein PBRA_009083 [Plasmodiophora brassicae]|uniref:Uncharacterized protein n=1 Tax=Plasmodiophora brassicae TaxID=37360 RepID=A0A0G4J523_PLABS|nr:hypothetical protein PBRA_009083 [Plasmodiophora brassicae]
MGAGDVDATDHPTTPPIASASPPTATSYKAARYPVVLGTAWGRSSTPWRLSLPAEDPRRHPRLATPWANGPSAPLHLPLDACRHVRRVWAEDVHLQDRTDLQSTVQHEHLQGTNRRS